MTVKFKPVAPIHAWLAVLVVCVLVVSISNAEAEQAFRMLIPGKNFPPWVYSILPYQYWEQIGAYERFLDCEKEKTSLKHRNEPGPPGSMPLEEFVLQEALKRDPGNEKLKALVEEAKSQREERQNFYGRLLWAVCEQVR